MIDYKKHLTPTSGITHREGDFGGFNEICFLVWLMVGLKRKGLYGEAESEIYNKHIELTEDETGGYKPKNSHDNLTYKICGSYLLGRDDHKRIKLLPLLLRVWYRPSDLVFYSFLLGGPVLRFLAGLCLPILAWFALHAAKSEGKIRPQLIDFEDPKASRLWFYLRKKKYLTTSMRRDGWVKTYQMSDNFFYYLRLHQNDGKHLYTFKLMVLAEKSKLMKLTFKKYSAIMKERYGEDYLHKVLFNYLGDKEHGAVKAWEGEKFD